MTSMLDSKANRPRCEPSTKREKGSNKLNLLSIDKVAGALGLFQVVLSGGHGGVWVAKKRRKNCKRGEVDGWTSQKPPEARRATPADHPHRTTNSQHLLKRTNSRANAFWLARAPQ